MTTVAERARPAPEGVAYGNPAAPEQAPARTAGRRWAALDVARGVAVAGMIVCEQMPGGPRPHPWLVHAQWNGWTGADLVFPAFLFLVGISVDEWMRRRGPGGLGRLARRAISLIVVGVLFNAWAADGANFADARWPGVLQRIGLVSLACGVVVALARQRVVPVLAVAGGLLVLYAQLLTRAPLDCGVGLVTPSCNVPGRVDLAIFGPAHIYHGGALGHDPEGMASTLGALATALVGVISGRLMRQRPGWRSMAVLGAAAAVMWSVTHYGFAGPEVNKRLWTPAFVLLTASTSIVLLLACHLVTDVIGAPRRARDGVARVASRVGGLAARIVAWPWAALGRNALVAYVGQHVLGAILARTPAHDGAQLTSAAGYLQNRVMGSGVLTLDSQWTYVAAMVLLWTAVAAIMHCARWHVTL